MRRHSLAGLSLPGSIAVLLWVSIACPVSGRSAGERGGLTPFQYLNPAGPRALPLALGARDVFHTAQGSTTWFGGTVWAADSLRWEAIEGGLWTFDTGVGSALVPPGGPGALSDPLRVWVDPFKQPGLHASMEGWIGFDNTLGMHPYFRRLSAVDPRWGTVCVGAAGGLEGESSYWAGVFPEEAGSLCYAGGQGYGNTWRICIERAFEYQRGTMLLGFRYRIDLEPGFDFVKVYVDTTGANDDVEFMSLTGSESGYLYRSLIPGEELPAAGPRTITLKFCVETDDGGSDEDGMHATTCGAFAVDDIVVSGVGILTRSTFEAGDDGWVPSPPEPGRGGEWSNLVALVDLPAPHTPCTCGLQDSVLVFHDDANGHGGYQDNLAVSPWIDLAAAGLVGSPGKVLRTHVYAEMPLKNYLFARFQAQWYPAVCRAGGQVTWSPWAEGAFVYYFGGAPQCTGPGDPGGVQVDWSAVIPPGAEQIRIGLGVVSYCRFFADCTGVTNTTPWFDAVGLGVYGTPGPPPIYASELDRPQDNFPENGTLNASAPGRVDCNTVQGAARVEPGTTLGDTLVVRGGWGNAEVNVHFRVTPGPGTNATRFNTWRNGFADSPLAPGFKVARCDTAERGLSGPIPGAWMTAFHEDDPNFTGTDRDIDPVDRAPNGGFWRLENDIFPDDLFAPGTRIDLFYSSVESGESEVWREPGLGSYEMEIMFSSPDAGIPPEWNCALYVDHSAEGAQEPIEEALRIILGMGSDNFEQTNWDRFDVNAPASGQCSFGRPLETEYGASLIQVLAYKAIIWSAGDLHALALTKEDADVLNPWLTLLDFDFNSLYLTGDGVVTSAVGEAASEPSARHLVEDLLGVTIRTECASGSFRDADCPSPGSPVDLTDCVELDPVTGAVVAGSGSGRAAPHGEPGNGCSEYRSFDVLATRTPEFGISRGDEQYSTPVKAAEFASVSMDAASSNILNFKAVIEGASVHRRGDTSEDCAPGDAGTGAVTERVREVLSYFGYAQAAICTDPSAGSGIEDSHLPNPSHVTRLDGITPNPLRASASGRIAFTLAREGRALIEVYDLQGRRVATVLDGTLPGGEHEVFWNGTESSGTPVGSGVYFLRLRAAGDERSTRLVVVKGG